MSLNGLEDPLVIDAYQAALAEAGGWFLLKYATRDTVELLSRGTGGVLEVRIAIEHYEEKSPIYGLLQYRRRKVILKYVPEGTSRLLQARLSVQFQSVLEKFTPHDTIFDFAASVELTEAALSSACTLHASIGSMTSSTSSLYRRRLGEITEDAEEEGSGERDVKEEPKASGLRHSILSDEENSTRPRRKSLDGPGFSAQAPTPDSCLPINNPRSTVHTPQHTEAPSTAVLDKSSQSAAEVTCSTTDGQPIVEQDETAFDNATPSQSAKREQNSESWRSANQTRPLAANSDPTNYYSGYISCKPKVKLAPRPSARRPGTASSIEARPVANLPNSVRVANRLPPSTIQPSSTASSQRSISPLSTRSFGSASPAYHNHTPPPPLPQPAVHISALYQPAATQLEKRPPSPSPSNGTRSLSSATSMTRPPRVTPEKQRLMRALQVYRKKQIAQAKQLGLDNQAPCGQAAFDRPAAVSQDPELLTASAEKNPLQQTSPRPMQNLRLCGQTSPPGRDVEEFTPPAVSSHYSISQHDMLVATVDPPLVDSSKATEPLFGALPQESATSGATAVNANRITVSVSQSPALSPQKSLGKASIDEPSRLQRRETEDHHSEVPLMAESAESWDNGEKADRMVVKPASMEMKAELINENLKQDSDGIAKLESAADESLPAWVESAVVQSSATNGQATTPSSPAKSQPPTNSESNESQSFDSQNKHQSMVDITEDSSSAEASEASEDEAVYDELQSATVEEAMPVIVARSPFSAVCKTIGNTDDRDLNISRSAPNGEGHSSNCTPEKANGGCVEILPAQPSTPAAPAQSLLTNKSNVSSGISRRIKALEVLSARGDGSPTSPSSTVPPSPPLTAGLVRKRMSSHSPQELTARSISISSPPAKEIQYPSPAPTPTPPLASKGSEPFWLEESMSTAELAVAASKGDSTSVTARIIQDSSRNKCTESVDPSEPVAMDLHRSPLVLGNERARSTSPPTVSNAQPSSAAFTVSTEMNHMQGEDTRSGRRRFSLSSNHSSPGKPSHPESATRRLSTSVRNGRRHSGKPPSASDSSSGAEDKATRGSRKDRLIRRMSVLSGASRRSIASAFGSNSLLERSNSELCQPPESIAEDSGELSGSSASITSPRAHVVEIGDVNIQFPDTLLWKRRFMRIDDQGYLILTPPTMEANRRGISRWFHLTEFRRPALPSVEREELPWSVLLDFEDGSCLQCACESRYAQGQILRMLTDAHDAYNNYIHAKP